MKALQTVAFAAASTLVLSVGALALEPITELLSEAQTAYMRGDIEAAKAKFESVNKLDPKNPVAIGYLRRIQVQEAERGGGSDRSFAKLIIPSVQFKEAQLDSVLDALKQQVAKASGGKQAVNFVVQLPDEQAKMPITLSLNNVPFTEVLKYVGTLAGATFVYDKYAVIVRPAQQASAQVDTKPSDVAK